MQRRFIKALIISMVGVVVLLLLLDGVSYLSQKDQERWYKESQGGRLYDNDMAGFAYGALYVISCMAALVILGFIAVIWAREDIQNAKDALIVSTISGSIPFLLLLIGSILLNMAATGIIVICLPCDLISLALACIGGMIAYAVILLSKRSGNKPSSSR